jgi:hypothetical protein
MTDAPLALTLKDAAERYGFTVATLRAEIARGRLTRYRIGKKDWTTPADIREMIEQCRVEPKAPAFTTRESKIGYLSDIYRQNYANRA